MPRLFLLLVLSLLGLASAQAQLEVTVELPRRAYLRGESIEAEVTIRNLSGHVVVLADTPLAHWFGFDVTRGADTPIGTYNAGYKNDPIDIDAGKTVKRTVDLLKLYPVNELGAYKVQAAIYLPELKKFFTSDPVNLDITDGKVLWRQTAGVPDGKEGSGDLREFSLVLFQKPQSLELYARVEDEATNNILATYPIGKMIAGTTPMRELNDDNTLYILHMNAPSQYALSKVGINGEWMGQTLWSSPTGRASVRRKPSGEMVVLGAQRIQQAPGGGPLVPKLSDRPVKVPGLGSSR
jgi:hypothetical protein